MNIYEKISFFPADILLPNGIDMTKWAVVACDQYTSQPDYWEEVREYTKNSPSAYNIVLPEIYLNDKNVEEKTEGINKTMKEYEGSVLKDYKNSYFYIERTQRNGRVRKGIVGMIDLDSYEFEPKNHAKIRATEGTVSERIPPRVKVRENADLELPHVLLLIDDKDDIVFKSIKKGEKLYDFDLLQSSGHIVGYNVSNNEEVADAFLKLKEKNFAQNDTMLFAVGDGNHSLATAKACWENIKKEGRAYPGHPAGYALVEVENIHDKALDFEPIHRVLFDCNAKDLLNELDKYCGITEEYIPKSQVIYSVVNCEVKKLYIKNPTSNLCVGTLQNFLDGYILKSGCKIDYIHGKDVVLSLSKKENSIGFLLDPMDKSDLFKTIIKDGILPRKTFSMGEAWDKRFYVEARKIR